MQDTEIMRKIVMVVLFTCFATHLIVAQNVARKANYLGPTRPAPAPKYEYCCAGTTTTFSSGSVTSYSSTTYSGAYSGASSSNAALQSSVEQFVGALSSYMEKKAAEKAEREERYRQYRREYEQEQRIIRERRKNIKDAIAKDYLYPLVYDKQDVNAMTLLGIYYQYSENDTAQASEWYLKAAMKGDGNAMGALGRIKEIAEGSKDPEVNYWYEEGSKRADYASLQWLISKNDALLITNPEAYDRSKAIQYRLTLDSIGYTDNFPRLYYKDNDDTLSVGRYYRDGDFDEYMVDTQLALGKAYYSAAAENNSDRKQALENSLKWLQETIATTQYVLSHANYPIYKWGRKNYNNKQKFAEKLSGKASRQLKKY